MRIEYCIYESFVNIIDDSCRLTDKGKSLLNELKINQINISPFSSIVTTKPLIIDINQLDDETALSVLVEIDEKQVGMNEDNLFSGIILFIEDQINQLETNGLLTSRKCKILNMRLNGEEYNLNTLETIGNLIGVSRERIRQLINKSIFKLRKRVHNNLKSIDSIMHLYDIEDNERAKRLFQIFINLLDRYSSAKVDFIMSLIMDKNYIGELHIIRNSTINRFYEHSAQERKIEKFDNWLADVIKWPKSINYNGQQIFENSYTVKKVNFEYPDSKSGVFNSNKMANEIEYASSLEYSVLMNLEKSHYIKGYKTHTEVVPFGEHLERRFYPDITAITVEGAIIIIELKPLFYMTIYENVLRFRALHSYCSQKGYGYVVMDDRRRDLYQIVNRPVKSDFENELSGMCYSRGQLSWRDVKEIVDKHGEANAAIDTVILRKKLKRTMDPFMIYPT